MCIILRGRTGSMAFQAIYWQNLIQMKKLEVHVIV